MKKAIITLLLLINIVSATYVPSAQAFYVVDDAFDLAQGATMGALNIANDATYTALDVAAAPLAFGYYNPYYYGPDATDYYCPDCYY